VHPGRLMVIVAEVEVVPGGGGSFRSTSPIVPIPYPRHQARSTSASPGANLALEAALVRDTTIERLIGQDSKLGLGHVEPAAMLGRVVPIETLDEAPCLQAVNAS
jgi:hypothetical protein